MKKALLTILGLLTFSTATSQTTLFEDSFENYENFSINSFGNWAGLDIDALNTYTGGLPDGAQGWANANQPQAFMVFNPSAAGVTNATTGTEVRNFDPKTGSKYAACWAAVPVDPILANNDWLISPPITLGASGNSLRFWVKSMSNTYGLEKYKVGIYVGSGTPTSASQFTIISGATNLTAPYPNWEEKVFALDAYNAQTVRIGINCVTADAYMFMVDDFKVTTTALATDEVVKNNTKIYPNPSKGEFMIKSPRQVAQVEIYDASGKMVLTTKSDKVDLTAFPKGTYNISITFEDGNKVEKKLLRN